MLDDVGGMAGDVEQASDLGDGERKVTPVSGEELPGVTFRRSISGDRASSASSRKDGLSGLIAPADGRLSFDVRTCSLHT